VGVDCTLFTRLVELSTRFQVTGRALMLGRQTFRIETPFRQRYEEALRAAGIDENRFAFLQEDGYSETLFAKLGLGNVETMDFSDFEGATILHDLNRPVPESLHAQFDFIFDGGTIEHVFNAPVALENMFRMLRVGHGMYQFNPELVWTFWRRTCNCRVHRCLGLKKIPGDAPALDFPDPAETGRRLRLKGRIPEGRVYLYYEVEKTEDSALSDSTLQSDYVARWDSHVSREATA